MAKRGRPSSYTQELADDLCEWLMSGKSMRAWSAQEGKPSMNTVLRWLGTPEREDFRGQYARAREVQAEVMFEDTLSIADDPRHDWNERYTRDGMAITAADHEHIQRSKLRVDTRKWMLARMAPKKYGDASRVALTDPDGGPISFAALAKDARDGLKGEQE